MTRWMRGALVLGVGGATVVAAAPPSGTTDEPPDRVLAGAAPGNAANGRAVPYDGRFTFVRIRFDDGRAFGRGFAGFGNRPMWAHDWPRADRNLMQILDEISLVAPHAEPNVLDLDDPELFRYPVAYICEVGFWLPTDAEVDGLREWLLRGGFLIVDDFRGPAELANFRQQMDRALPGVQLLPLDVSHPVFRSFFVIEALDMEPPYARQYTPAYYGIFEENDPSRRLMVVVNHNNDIGDYWEYTGTGFYPVSETNEAYKLGINYIMYGLLRS